MQQVITKIIPIFLLILVGYVLRRTQFITDIGIHALKKIIVNITLPFVLFKAFFIMELKKEYIVIVLLTITMYITSHTAGKLLQKIKFLNYRLMPYFTASCAFGLLGIPLFQIVFGEENLNYLSILGIGNEFFTWFILITLLKFDLNHEKFSLQTVSNFMKSPMIMGVITGLLLNIFKINTIILNNFILKGFYDGLDALAGIATPLILIVTGYGMVINKHYLKQSIKYVSVRLVVLFTIGYGFKYLLYNYFIQNIMFDFAFFTFIILSPPLLLPIIAADYCEKEEIELGNNIIIVSICASLVLFVGYVLFNSANGLI